MVTDLDSNQQIAWLTKVMCTQLITVSHALNGHRLAFRSADCLAQGSVVYSSYRYKACA